MAEPDTSYSGGPISQHQDQGTHVHNYQQSYDLSSGFNYFPWSPQPYAVASRFEQPQGSSWQRRTHQQPEFQYAGGFSPAAYMGASGAGAQYGPTEVLGNYQSDIGSYPWFDGEHYANGSPNDQNMPRTLHPGMDMPNFAVSPAHSHWVQPPPQYPSRRLSRHVPSSPSPPPTSEMIAAVHDVPNRANSVTTESFPQHGVPFVRRTSYHRPARQGMEDSNSQQRRHMFRPVNGSAPLPELTPLSRNSNRRSFDRYANDLQNEATELARPARSPASRAADRPPRRQRAGAHPSIMRARFLTQTEHPNVPSPGQMQALRDKLRHFLPKELPEGIDAMCDICQKDYSEKHVDPSEDNEIAIQLPCKHVFGEYCINTWFDTCRKQKNKITCPMCRKTLIEPPSRGSVHSPSRMFLEGLHRYRREGIGRQFLVSMPGGLHDQVGVAVSPNFQPYRVDGA